MNFIPEDYLNAAQDSIKAAELLLHNSLHKGSVNRSYYGIFYFVQALVLSEGAFAKTHSGLKSKFHELFVKPGKIEIETAKQYDRLFQERLAADYDIDAEISAEEAKEAMHFAQMFFEFTSSYFKK